MLFNSHKIDCSDSWLGFHGEISELGFVAENIRGSTECWLLKTENPQVEWINLPTDAASWDRLDFKCTVSASAAVKLFIYIDNIKVFEQVIKSGVLNKISFQHTRSPKANGSQIKIRLGTTDNHENLKFLIVAALFDGAESEHEGLKITTSYSNDHKTLRFFEFVFYASLFVGSFLFIMEHLNFQRQNASFSAATSALFGAAIVLLGRLGITTSSLSMISRRFLTPTIARNLSAVGIVLLIPAVAYSAMVIDCAYSSDRYKRNVKDFVFSDDLSYAETAWNLFPERIEVYMAVNRALAERRIDPTEKKEFAANFINAVNFIDHNELRFGFRNLIRRICPCLIGEHENATVQLAMIAPDAQGSNIAIRGHDSNYTSLAQTKLSKVAKDNLEAQLLQYILDSPLVGSEKSFLGFKDYGKYLKSLEIFLNENRQVIGQSQLYQEALSLLGGRAITLCYAPNPLEPGASKISSSISYYSQLISAREATYSSSPRWTRPPNKMTFHAILMSLYGIPTSKEQDWTLPLSTSTCKAFKESLEKEFGKPRYKSWHSQAAWTRGTIYHPNVRGQNGFWVFLEHSLATGWKY